MVLIAIILVVVGIYSMVLKRPLGAIDLNYHQSAWNEYTPNVELALGEMGEVGARTEPIKLGHVYGTVMSHHIPTTIPKLVENYSRIKEDQTVKKIIIIGPDHNDAGKTPVSISQEKFVTNFGELSPELSTAYVLLNSGVAAVDEAPFDLEHSVGSQVLVISRVFPEAKILPIIVRSDLPRIEAIKLGNVIADQIDEETILVASVDFSHYLTSDRAMPLDEISGDIVRRLDLDAIGAVKVDSMGAVLAFMQAMKAKKATVSDGFEVLNTRDFMENSDYTTGYVFGFWGH